MEDIHKTATSNKTDPTKYYTNFLYKAAIVSVVLLIFPVLPSQAPEFINQNRSWELLQLLFVGLAVSYGLFSRKNDKIEHDYGAKFDNAHTYLSRFLQVSSVFDEETDNPANSEERKVHMWSNRYYREEPVLVVAEKNFVFEEQCRVNSVSTDKPLLLPIRSLKSRVSEPDKTTESSERSKSFNRSNYSSSSISGSKRFHSDYENYENGENGDFNSIESEIKSGENVVLRSPIPWRSRSGRMEMREDIEPLPMFSLESETEHSISEALENPSFRPSFAQPSKPNSKNAENLTESKPIFSLDSGTEYSDSKPIGNPSSRTQFANHFKSNSKIVEDLARNNIYRNSRTPPPAPPPPPPPRHHRKPPLGKSIFVPVKETQMREIEELESDEETEMREIEELESDEETEDENIEGEKEEEIVENGGSDLGPDVNKKADEFIAKFREQIRLQRIETLKQIGRNSTR